MTSPFADASVEIVADFDTFDDDFKRRLEASIKRASRNAGKQLDDISLAAKRVGRSITSAMGDAASGVRNAFARLSGGGVFQSLALGAQMASARIQETLGGPGVAGVIEDIGDASRRAGLRLGIDLPAGADGARAAMEFAFGRGPGGARKLLEDVGDSARTAAARIAADMGMAGAATRGAFIFSRNPFDDLADDARAAAIRIVEAMAGAGAAVRGVFRFGEPFGKLMREAAEAAAAITGAFRLAGDSVEDSLRFTNPFRMLGVWARQAAGEIEDAFERIGNPFRALGIEARRAGEVIEGSLVRASIGIRSNLAITSGIARGRFDAIADGARAAGRRITTAMTAAATLTTRAWRGVGDAFGPLVAHARVAAVRVRSIFAGVGRGLNRALDIGNPFRGLVLVARLAGGAITRAMNEAGRSALRVLTVITMAGAAAGGVGLLAGGLGALAGAAASLVAALAPMAGALLALPAAAAAGGVAMATLKLGVHGLTDAFGAMDDAKEFDAALRKLAPSAREFAITVRDIKPAFESMRGSVQQNLFAGLSKTLANLARNLLPAVRIGLGRMARELNGAAKELGGFLSTAGARNQLAGVFKVSADAAHELRGALVPVTSALLGLVNAGGPGMLRMAGAVRDVAERFAGWVKSASASGQINDMIQTGLDVAKQFGAVLGNIGGIIAAVFRAGDAAGGGLLNNLQEITGAAREFLNSVQGQSALGSFFGAIAALVKAVIPIVIELADIIGTSVAPIIRDLALAMGPGLTAGLDALGKGLQALVPAAGPVGAAIGAIASTIGTLGAAVGPAIAEALTTIMPAFAQLLSGLGAGLAPVITGLAAGLAAMAPAFAPIGELFAALGPVIGSVAAAFGPLIAAIAGPLATALTALIPVVRPVIDMLAGELGKIIPVLVPPILELGTVLVEALVPPLLKLLPLFTTVVKVLADMLAPILDAVGPLLAELVPPIVAVASTLVKNLIPVFQMVAPLVAKIAKMLGPLLGPVITALVPIMNALLKVIEPILGLFIALVTPILDLLPPLVTGLMPAFTAIAKIVGIVGDVLAKLVPIILSALMPLIDALLPALMPVVDIFVQLLNIIAPLLAGLLEPILGIAVMLADFLIIKPLVALLGDLAGVLKPVAEWLGSVAKWLSNIDWEKTLDSIAGFFPAVWSAITGFFAGIGKAIGDFFSGVGDKIVGFFNWYTSLPGRILKGITTFISDMYAKWTGMMAGILTAIVDKGAEILNWFTNLAPEAIQKPLRALIDKVKNIGHDIIQGLLDAFESAKKKVKDTIGALASAIPDTLKKILGIASRSKVMARLGGDVIDGLHAGLAGGVSQIVSAMDDVAAAVARDLPGPVIGAPVLPPPVAIPASTLAALTAGTLTPAAWAGTGAPTPGPIPAQRGAPGIPGAGPMAGPGTPAIGSLVQNITLPTGDPEAAAQAAINRIAVLVG